MKKKTWTTLDGRKIEHKKITDAHLTNALRWLAYVKLFDLFRAFGRAITFKPGSPNERSSVLEFCDSVGIDHGLLKEARRRWKEKKKRC